MKYLGKKAMTINFLVAMIIVLVAFAVIAGVLTQTMLKATDKEAEQLCRNWLVFKSKTQVTVGAEEVTPASASFCKTIDKKFSVKTKEKAMKFAAENLERCWWIWLEGTQSELLGPRGTFKTDEKTKCFVCHVLLYKEGPSFTKNEFLNYLKNNNAKYAKKSYLDYFQTNGYVEIEDKLEVKSPGAYAVVFANNIQESFWTSTYARLLGFYPEYDRNGVWLFNLNTLNKEMPCYMERDVGGE